MAIARWIFVEIVLMVFLGLVKVLQGQFLHGELLLIVFLFFSIHLIYNSKVFDIGVVYAGAILCAFVMPLLSVPAFQDW